MDRRTHYHGTTFQFYQMALDSACTMVNVEAAHHNSSPYYDSGSNNSSYAGTYIHSNPSRYF